MMAIDELRIQLSAENIPYENSFMDMERIKIPSMKDCEFSIIQGKYSYGGKDNLLEM